MSKPFSRSMALFAAIQTAFVDFGSQRLALQQHVKDLSQRKEFQSRGHGRNKRSGVNVKVYNKMRRHSSKRYVPYGGAKEIARRAGWSYL